MTKALGISGHRRVNVCSGVVATERDITLTLEPSPLRFISISETAFCLSCVISFGNYYFASFSGIYLCMTLRVVDSLSERFHLYK